MMAAIVGFGDAYLSSGESRSAMDLAMDAASSAMSGAGLSKHEIDGLLTGRSPMADPREQWNVILAGSLGMRPQYSTQVTTHSAGAVGMMSHATAAIAAGLAETVLCVASDAAPAYCDPTSAVANLDVDPRYELALGATALSMYGLHAARYLHEYALGEEDMALASVSAQKWGAEHPYATRRAMGSVSVDRVLESRYVARPLRSLNCAPWGPAGTGGAYIVTSDERAADLGQRPIYIRGFGTEISHQYMHELANQAAMRDGIGVELLGRLSPARKAADIAYRRADLGPGDIDAVFPSTAFSHVVLMTLEDLGFCEPGGASAFVRSGAIDPGGRLPFNTNGGWLSYGQPGISCTMDQVMEACRQLSGNALGISVDGCNSVIVHGMGGICSCADIAVLSVFRG